MPASDKQKTYTTNEKIPDNLKCPVCFELLLSPIYQCEVGHNICHSCIDNVSQCPLCKGDYGDTRNYFAEELVNTSTFPCKYEEYGCACLFHGSELKGHQAGCNFQPYRCPEMNCKEVFGSHQMSQHLEKHGFKVFEGDALLATFDIQDGHFDKKVDYNPWRISTFNREFYAVATRQKDGFWFLWTWILGNVEEAKKFSAEIMLASSDQDVIYRGPVHSLRSSPDDIMKAGTCLIVSDDLIKSLRKNKQITYGIRFIEGKNWNSKKVKASKKANLKTMKQARKNITKIINNTTTVASNLGSSKVPKELSPFAKPLVRPSTSTNVGLTLQKPSCSKSCSCPRPNTVATILNKPKTPPSTLVGKTSKVSVSKTPKLLGDKAKATKRPIPTPLSKKTSLKPLKVNDDNNALIKSLKESLVCPGCQQVITPPVYQCCIGHNICSKCKETRTDCPLCRAPTSQGTRNFFAEELLYKTVQKCRFHSCGCEVSLPIAQIRLHEVLCEHAPYECPFSTCYQEFPGKDIVEHLKSHQISIVQKEMTLLIPIPKLGPSASSPILTIPSIIQYNGIGFFPVVCYEKSGSWSFWVSSHEHHNYQYEIIIKKQFKTLVYHGPVVSLRAQPSQIKAHGSCLITSDRIIKTMKNTNGEFELTVHIISSDGSCKLPESFSIPTFYGERLRQFQDKQNEKTKLCASTKTSMSEHPSDSEDEGETLEEILNFVISEEALRNSANEPITFSITERANGFSLQPINSPRRTTPSIREIRRSSDNSSFSLDSTHDHTDNDDDNDSSSTDSEIDIPATTYSSEEFLLCPSAPENSLTDVSIPAAVDGKLKRSSQTQTPAQPMKRCFTNANTNTTDFINKVKSMISDSEKSQQTSSLDTSVTQKSLLSKVKQEIAELAGQISKGNNRTTLHECSSIDNLLLQVCDKLQNTKPKSNNTLTSGIPASTSSILKNNFASGLKNTLSARALLLNTKSSDDMVQPKKFKNNNHQEDLLANKSPELFQSEAKVDEESTDSKKSVKVRRSCLKLTSRGNSGTDISVSSRPKQQLHVKFADLIEGSEDEEKVKINKMEELNNDKAPSLIISSKSDDSLKRIELLEKPLAQLPEEAQSNLNVGDFTDKKSNNNHSKQQRKKHKNKNKNKKASMINKRKAQASLFGGDDDGSSNKIDPAQNTATTARDDNNNVVLAQAESLEKDDKTQSNENDLTSFMLHRNSATLIQEKISEHEKLLIDLNDVAFDKKPLLISNLHTPQNMDAIFEEEPSNDVMRVSTSTIKPDNEFQEKDDENYLSEEEENINNISKILKDSFNASDIHGYDSLHSLCLTHGLNTSKHNNGLSYTILNSTTDSIMGTKVPILLQSESCQTHEEASQACQVGSSLFELGKEAGEIGNGSSDKEEKSEDGFEDDTEDDSPSLSKSIGNLTDELISTTCSAVKSLFNGIVGDDDDDGNIEDEYFDVDDPSGGETKSSQH